MRAGGFVRVVFCLFFIIFTMAGVTFCGLTERIDSLSGRLGKLTDEFEEESFNLLCEYWRFGRIYSEKRRRRLGEICEKYKGEFASLLEEQVEIKDVIGDYEGEGWEERFGETGAWEKIRKDVCITQVQIGLCDFYGGIVLDDGKEQVIEGLCERLARISESCGCDGDILRMRCMGELAEYGIKKDELCLELDKVTSEEFSQLQEVEFELIKAGLCEDVSIGEVGKKLLTANEVDLFLTLRVGLEAGGIGDEETFEKILFSDRFAQAREKYGEFLLGLPLEDKFFNDFSEFEAELFAYAAMDKDAGKYREKLVRLAERDDIENVAVLYACGLAMSGYDEEKSIGYLIEASGAAENELGKGEGWDSRQIAITAAIRSYGLWERGEISGNTARVVYENYFELVEQPEPEMMYFYGILLEKEGFCEQAEEMLEKTVQRGEGKWSQWARLGLVRKKIGEGDAGGVEQELEEIIEHCEQVEESERITFAAELLKASVLIESGEKGKAEEAIRLLEGMGDGDDILLLKSRAYFNGGRLLEAIEVLVIDEGKKADAPVWYCENLLDEVIWCYDREEYGWEGLVLAGLELAKKWALSSQKDARKSVFIEMEIIAAREQDEILSVKRRLEDNLERFEVLASGQLRCLGRMAMKMGEFCEAGRFWARICREKSYGGNENDSLMSEQWWRAKYYELYCCKMAGKPGLNELERVIDVILAENDSDGVYWKRRLKKLVENGG